jgi:hypothetical protein
MNAAETGTTSTAEPAADDEQPAMRQSLSRGALGTALLHAMRSDDPAHAQALNRLARAAMPLVDGSSAGIFFGAPALTYVLHVAGWTGPTMDHLDDVVTAHARARLAAAHQRIDAGQPAAFAEYDLMHGLTGIGALLLTRGTDDDTTRALLAYLVRLTEPLRGADGAVHPGWRVWHHHSAPERPGPHTNAGLAHGITGPLAVLALATQRGIRVPGDHDAIGRILDWLDAHRRPGGGWARWTDDHDDGPMAPSWCYGAPGIARAQQAAAIAIGDRQRKAAAEKTLAACLADPAQADALVGEGLCHGAAGVLQAVRRVAANADDPRSFDQNIEYWTNRVRAARAVQGPGLLEGMPGVQLAIEHRPGPETPDWDACLALA